MPACGTLESYPMDQESTPKKILSDLKNGIVAPCYLLYGDEEYLIRSALRDILDILLPGGDRDLTLLQMDGENEDVGRICEELLTPSLIPGRKVVVLRNTQLLYSRRSIPDLMLKVRETMEQNPALAADRFLVFIRSAGWTINDLKDGNWKRIPEEDWNRLTGEAVGERDRWLPKIIDICLQQGFDAKRAPGEEEEVGRILSEGLPEGHCLVMTADLVDRRKKLFKIVSEKGVLLGFHRARSEVKQKGQFYEQAKEFLREQRKEIEPAALLALGRKTGFNLPRAMLELEKLTAYAGDQSRIEEEDVENATGKTREETVFSLTASLMEKDPGNAIAVLHGLLGQGVHYLVILSMIIREYRFLLHAKAIVSSGRIPQSAGKMDFASFQKSVLPTFKELSSDEGRKLELLTQHPYVIYNAFRFSERFSMDVLIRNLEHLLEADGALKTTGLEPQTVMERLIIRICGDKKE